MPADRRGDRPSPGRAAGGRQDRNGRQARRRGLAAGGCPELRVNPRGNQTDAIWNDGTQNEDLSPDFFYDTAAQLTGDDWTADVRDQSGSFAGSALFAYQINWQTVLFVGYADDRLQDPLGDLQPADRLVFVKVSYAFQR
jgi:hypothetical protein